MRAIKPSVKRMTHLKVTPGLNPGAGAEGRHFQTHRLCSPSLLNHHLPGHLCDRRHDISPVRAAARMPPAADSDNEAGGVPPPLCFPLLSPRLHAAVLSVT